MTKSILIRYSSEVEYDFHAAKTRGLPGTEQSVLCLAEGMQRYSDYSVSLCSDRVARTANCSVRFIRSEEVRTESFDVLLDVRRYAASHMSEGIDAVRRVLWTHDSFSDLSNLAELSGRDVADMMAYMNTYDMVVCVSKWHREDLLSHGLNASRSTYIYNPIPTAQRDQRVRYENRVINTGHPRKALLNILRIAARVSGHSSDVEFFIFGRPDLYGERGVRIRTGSGAETIYPFDKLMETLAPADGNVFLSVRSLARHRLYREYQKAQVFLHPADSAETFGCTVAEAMANGCVPIVSARGALPEVVGIESLILSTDDGEMERHFADMVIELCTCPARANEYRRAVVDRAELFSPARVISAWGKVL